MEYEKQPSGIPPKNYLVESILVTCFCCLPLGIIGLVHAMKVESLFNEGDVHGAEVAAETAKKWVKIGFVLGIITAAVVIAIYGIGIFIMLTHRN